MRSRRNTKANLSILLQYYGREERDQSVSMLCTFNLKRSSKLVPCYFVLHITPGPAAPSYKSNQTPTWFHTTEGGFFPSCKVDICLFINFPKHPLLKLLIFLWCKIVPAKFWELSQILPKLADWAVHGWSSTGIGGRMSQWKWRETKQHPSSVRSGHQVSCCLISLHFRCDILAPIPVG